MSVKELLVIQMKKIELGSIVANRNLKNIGDVRQEVVLNLFTKHSAVDGPIPEGTALLSDFSKHDVQDLYVSDDSIIFPTRIVYPLDHNDYVGKISKAQISERLYVVLWKKLLHPQGLITTSKVAHLIGWEERELILNYIYQHDYDFYLLSIKI